MVTYTITHSHPIDDEIIQILDDIRESEEAEEQLTPIVMGMQAGFLFILSECDIMPAQSTIEVSREAIRQQAAVAVDNQEEAFVILDKLHDLACEHASLSLSTDDVATGIGFDIAELDEDTEEGSDEG